MEKEMDNEALEERFPTAGCGMQLKQSVWIYFSERCNINSSEAHAPNWY
jgi:hypothetical protein